MTVSENTLRFPWATLQLPRKKTTSLKKKPTFSACDVSHRSFSGPTGSSAGAGTALPRPTED
ncbi:hypothetical protein, partial [Virgibacillus halodenitrificans]|uniref:hypothetical protein n=1 Tax=Virgibacillus halodenitrificans TaxID=1482 RepID=UPI001C475264